MSENSKINFGCSDGFAELCALSTTHSLSQQEWQRLEEHIRICAECSLLLADYQSLASEGMANVAAVRSAGSDAFDPDHSWARDEAKLRLLSSPRVLGMCRRTSKQLEATKAVAILAGIVRLFRPPMFLRTAAAAVLVLAALATYQVGVKRGVEHAARLLAPSTDEVTLRRQLAEVQAQRALLAEKLLGASEAIDALQRRASRTGKYLGQVQALKASLEGKIQELSIQNQQQSAAVTALSADRDSLQQQLREKENSLRALKEDLSVSEDERKKILLNSASLQEQISQMSVELHEREQSSHRQEQYLASDRDIRELMGARQLYISDVFDIDPQGKMKKPFGRMFYTKGKSLIFYAFDLDQEPGYREAKAFQAWGRRGESQATPVSLGIFYLDNESNRRWALKFDDPKVLEEINSVFVTVEPKGGSKKPTQKPFLVAYLHSAPPNHP